MIDGSKCKSDAHGSTWPHHRIQRKANGQHNDRKILTHYLLPACPDAFSVKGCLDMHGVFTITRILPHMAIPDSLTQGSFI